MNSPVLCGWYTPTYGHWLDKLLPSATAIGLDYDFIAAPEIEGRWEDATMLKAGFAIEAMRRHPDRTLLFVDVDCLIAGSRQQIIELCDIAGDIGLFLRTRWNSHGKVRVRPRSGTMVIRPTRAARAFLEAWASTSREAPAMQVDEASLLVTLGRVPGCSITLLPIEAVAIRFDHGIRPLILHASASADGDLHTSGLAKLFGGRPFWRNWFPAEM